MRSKVQKITNFTYQGRSFGTLYVIMDANGSPPILPLMYTAFLSRFGSVYEAREVTDATSKHRFSILEPRDISDSTIRAYIYNLARFLTHLENKGPFGMHASHACSDRFVNFYLNEILAKEFNSYNSLEVHRASLVAYFNWLEYLTIRQRLELRIARSTKQKVAERSNTQHYIQYVTRHGRSKLLSSCESLGEKLILRMGFEVGLRTSEVAGLMADGTGNLLETFAKLDSPRFNHYEYFSYLLQGRYTKGGKSRWIYFDRDLVHDMRRYFNTERKWLSRKMQQKPAELFLRRDNGSIGRPIGKEQASRVFRKTSKLAGLNPLLSFHDLRHTFATELFHSEILGREGRETRSESAALIVVAQRLGHSFTREGQAPATTVRYIRMRLHLLEMESERNRY